VDSGSGHDVYHQHKDPKNRWHIIYYAFVIYLCEKNKLLNIPTVL
jgi:hypothetical protein